MSLPLVEIPGVLPSDESITLFSFTASAAHLFRAETRAVRLSPPSDGDTYLVLVDATGPGPVILALNDDIDSPGENYDSLLQTTVANAGTHQLVLDYVQVSGVNRSYEITISEIGGAAPAPALSAIWGAALALALLGAATASWRGAGRSHTPG